MPRIISFGEALTDAFAAPGLLLREAKTLHTRPGGEPANGAVALARLGSEVGLSAKWVQMNTAIFSSTFWPKRAST